MEIVCFKKKKMKSITNEQQKRLQDKHAKDKKYI